ncbi:MAG TPA: PL29 family lyase N-terminal domain-containing protein, partial [Sphingobacterium sp.]|nr:PL29 family lyase N-terminal domain-containing protein [Sphingobacterium sp.]
MILFCTLMITIGLAGCSKSDLNEIRDEINKNKELIAQLQNTLNTLNTDIKNLQAITAALQNKLSVVSYSATATGYLLQMSDGSTIELKHGTNGANGTNGTNGRDGADAPQIGVRQDTDGRYYWTLGGEWLLQNGQKLPVTGRDGTNGT